MDAYFDNGKPLMSDVDLLWIRAKELASYNKLFEFLSKLPESKNRDELMMEVMRAVPQAQASDTMSLKLSLEVFESQLIEFQQQVLDLDEENMMLQDKISKLLPQKVVSKPVIRDVWCHELSRTQRFVVSIFGGTKCHHIELRE